MLQLSVVNSKAKNTTNAYSSGFSQWQRFASIHHLSILPADPTHVALFLQSKATENKSPSCLINLLYGVAWAHKCAVLPFPSNHPLIDAVIESQKRSIKVNKNPKDELSQSVIRRLLVESAKTQPLLHLRFASLLVLCYTGMLRVSEALCLRRNQIRFLPDAVKIELSRSKTNQKCQKETIILSNSDSRFSPHKVFKDYFTLANIVPSSKLCIFRNVTVRNGVYKLNRKLMSYANARQILIQALTTAGLDAKNFGWHSFRRGAATDADARGLPHDLIRSAGRWKTDSAKELYVRRSLQRKALVSRTLVL